MDDEHELGKLARELETTRKSSRHPHHHLMAISPSAVLLLLHATAAAAQLSPGRLPPGWLANNAAAPPPPPGVCRGGPCGGMARYPAQPGIVFESVFDVPAMPKKQDGICFYIYFNIFFRAKVMAQ